MARHLASARRRVLGRADRLEHHGLRADPERENESPVAVVGEEPVRCRAHRSGQSREDDLVTSSGNLEEHPALLLQQDLAVVESTRQA